MDTKIDISKLHNNLLHDLIFNDTNLYLSLLEEKDIFFRVRLIVRVIDAYMELISIEYSF